MPANSRTSGRFLFLLISVLLTLGAAAGRAAADGKVLWLDAAPPRIPDQQALIHWDPGTRVQTLAIETRYEVADDKPREAAWVVPLPGAGPGGEGTIPTIEAASTGLFPTLRTIFQPRLRAGPSHVWVLVLVLCVPLALLAFNHKSLALRITGYICFVLVAMGVLLPTLGKARSSGGPDASDVRILDRQIVGAFETLIVGAADGADASERLTSWLNEHGFAVPKEAAPVLADYAKRGWVFACARLTASAAETHVAPHPLVFRFQTQNPVYPLALTAVGNGDLTVDLYVFGHARARATNFDCVRCSEPIYPPEPEFALPYRRHSTRGQLVVVHDGLRSLTNKAPVATKLSATLSPRQQQSDAIIEWEDFAATGEVLMSRRGAIDIALTFASLALLVLTFVMVIASAFRWTPRTWRPRTWAIASAAIACAGLVAFLSTPHMPSQGRFHRASFYERAEAIKALAKRMPRSSREPLTAPEVGAWLAMQLLTLRQQVPALADIRYEDSPWNYKVTESGAVIVIKLHDAFGYGEEVATISR